MEWAIIVLIVVSLIGSMMWVMPSPRQRFQSKLRLNARKFGFNVSLAHIKFPRAQGEIEGEVRHLPVYRKVRTNLHKKARQGWQDWSVCRVISQAKTGLPEGWSWIKGEFEIKAPKCEQLSAWLETLPREVVAVESTNLHLSLYWTEPDIPGGLETLNERATTLIELNL